MQSAHVTLCLKYRPDDMSRLLFTVDNVGEVEFDSGAVEVPHSVAIGCHTYCDERFGALR